MGRINFDADKGYLCGGYLIPLIDDLNECKLKYDFNKNNGGFKFTLNVN